MKHQRDQREDQQQMNQETCDVKENNSANPHKQQQSGKPQEWTESHRSFLLFAAPAL
jgi:hypothetical protein